MNSMKLFSRSLLAISFTGLALFLHSCKEDPVGVELNPTFVQKTDTTYIGPVPVQDPKIILIEDLTGVRCPNCPKAHEKGVDIQAARPGRVLFVSMHPDNQGFIMLTRNFKVSAGDEYDSKYDFRTPEAGIIAQDLGLPPSLPKGAINRRLFAGETQRLMDFQKWEGYVSQEETKAAPCNISLSQTFDQATRKCVLKVKVSYTANVTETHYLSLSLLESGMVDPQEDNSTGVTELDSAYVHNHVLRKMFTPALGVLLNAKLEPGRVFEKEFEMDFASEWVWNNCEILAFVHESTQTKNVVQAAQIKVQ